MERLRKKNMQSERNYFDTGKDDGIRWAKSAHHEDLKYVLNMDDFVTATKDKVVGAYFTEKLQGNS